MRVFSITIIILFSFVCNGQILSSNLGSYQDGDIIFQHSASAQSTAVQLATKTRIGNPNAPKITTDFITWGAGPRASQYLIIGAKCHAALRGRYSPDIDDVKTIAKAILRHRLVRNYRAEAEGYSMDQIIDELSWLFFKYLLA